MLRFLFPSILLFPVLLAAACGDSNSGHEMVDGGDAAAGTVTAGTGGISGRGGSGPGSGGKSSADSTPGTGGKISSGGVSGASVDSSVSGGAMDVGGIDSQWIHDAPGSEDGTAGQACTYEGKNYPNLSSWWAPDGCNECSCNQGHAGCGLVPCNAGAYSSPCSYGGKTYPFGVTFPSTDGCNTCECHWNWWNGPGVVACTQNTCSGSPSWDALPASDASDASIDACTYNGKTYPVDVYFQSADGCDACHCRADGKVTCTFDHIGCPPKVGVPDGSVDAPTGA